MTEPNHDPVLQPGGTAPVSSSDGQRAATPSWVDEAAVKEIHNAFRLGWSLVELRSRVQLCALDDTTLLDGASSDTEGRPQQLDPLAMVREANDGLLRASQMRTLFNRIVTLHRSSLPGVENVSKIYDPPSEEELTFLFSEAPDDYANIGILPREADDGGRDQFWPDFRLYGVTRRALNCLNLLLSNPLDNLVPDLITSQQNRLLESISASYRETRSDTPEAAVDGVEGAPAPTMADSLMETTLQACAAHRQAYPGELYREQQVADDGVGHKDAIMALSVLTSRLFQAWDGYLREQFSRIGAGATNLHTLLAYEAGRNLASISWRTSVNASRLEKGNEGDDDAREKLCQMWQSTFSEGGVVDVLHQITALSSVCDDIYYGVNEKPAAFSTDSTFDDLLVRPDPALPSNVIQAVKQSIEYWQRTIDWLVSEEEEANADAPGIDKPQMSVADWRRLREALIVQSGIWYNLMTGQQDLRGYTVEGIAQDIMDEALDNLQALAQRDLPAAFQEASRHLNEMARDVSAVAREGINQVFDSINPVLWIVIGISGVFVAILIVYALSTGQTEALIGAVASIGTAVAGMFGIRKGSDSKEESKEKVTEQIDSSTSQLQATVEQVQNGIAGTAGSALDQAGSFLVEAYEKGLLRIQIELQSLNHAVAVTHPLVAFFIRHSDVKSDLDFATMVIWDKGSRETQLRNVVTAAFGPISLLLGTPAGSRNGASGEESV